MTRRLKLNADKTEYITFGSRSQLWKVSSSPQMAGNDVIQMSSDVKYLGGILDNKLNFNKYISLEIKKTMSNFICIRAIWKYFSKQACTTHTFPNRHALHLYSCYAYHIWTMAMHYYMVYQRNPYKYYKQYKTCVLSWYYNAQCT